MKGRPITFVLLLALVGGIWGVWHVVSTREPEYEGKRLGDWLRDLEVNNSPADYDQAAKAVRTIGTNALPFLLRKLTANDSRWKADAVDTMESALNVDLNESRSSVQRSRATIGFRVLGQTAEAAIPKLTRLTGDADPQTAVAALTALREIGGTNVIPPLLNALTNGNSVVRPHAAFNLGALRSRARVAVPALLQALEASDINLRMQAAAALREISTDPQLTIPVLTRALADADPRVRANAASALGTYGTLAESTLPLIRSLPKVGEEFATRMILRAAVRVQCEVYDGAIIRGPKTEKRIAFVFTAHDYAESGELVLNELQKHNAKASFFLTGAFLDHPEFRPLIDRILAEGHGLGPHSDQHLLYCAWEPAKPTLVTEEEFTRDLAANLAKLAALGVDDRRFARYFLPPYEHYNRDIYDWSRKQRRTLINFTPGTRANADYTGEADKNFVPTQVIYDSIIKKEREDPHGLNGFILFLHIGPGPRRTDKFHARFGELLDYLSGKGYQFVRVDELLEAKVERANTR